MQIDMQQRAAELFPQWPAERCARWAQARERAGAPRVRIGCACQCDAASAFAPRTLREAAAMECAARSAQR